MDQTSAQFQRLYNAMSTLVNECMSDHDPSHNPAHVHRVVNLATSILKAEQAQHPNKTYDTATIKLAALLHDIGDSKYLPHITSTTANDKMPDPSTMVQTALRKHGAPPELAAKVQTVVSHVSYTTECKDPAAIQRLIDGGLPELGIVQDADRLDAIGAIGIGRTFTFLGAQGKKFAREDGWEMGNSIQHFEDKLLRIADMMKTQTGRELACERTRRLCVFKKWFEEEMAAASSGV